MKKRVIIIGTILVLIGLGIYLTAIGDDARFLVADDGYYYLDIVKDGNVFNPTADRIGSYATGYHPLWYLILEFVAWVTSTTGLPLLMIAGHAVMIVGLFTWWKAFQFVLGDNWRAQAYAAFMILFPGTYLMSLTGLETPVVVAALGYFVWASIADSDDKHLLISSILLFLSRTDLVLLVVPVLLWKRDKMMLTTICSVVAIYLFWNWTVTGTALQTSGGVYPELRWGDVAAGRISMLAAIWEWVKNGFNIIGDYAGWWLFYLAPIMIAIGFRDRIDKSIFAISAGLVWLFVVHAVFRLTFQPWYAVPFFCISVFIIAHQEGFSTKWAKTYGGAIVLAIAVGLSLISINLNGSIFHKYSRHWTSTAGVKQIAAAEQLRRMGYHNNLGAFNSGQFGLYCDNVVNLDGLVNCEVLEAYKKGAGVAYLRQHFIHFIVDVDYYFSVFDRYIPRDSLEFVGHVKIDNDTDPNHRVVVMRLKN